MFCRKGMFGQSTVTCYSDGKAIFLQCMGGGVQYNPTSNLESERVKLSMSNNNEKYFNFFPAKNSAPGEAQKILCPG